MPALVHVILGQRGLRDCVTHRWWGWRS